MAESVKRFSLKAPPPRVVLVPDGLFFVRSVPIGEAADADSVASQVDLALEALAPFPLAQLYYGHFWAPGARSAVVYAAYRKRFTAEQTEAWSNAEIVLPAFATLLTAPVQAATTVVLTLEDGITAIHWAEPNEVPTAIVSRSWTQDTSAAEKLRARDEILRSLGGTRSVIDLDSLPVIEGNTGGTEFTFRAGSLGAVFTREQLDSMDVRDKADLLGRRRARMRDLYLWRGFLACVAGVALAALLEVGVVGGRVWLRSRHALVEKQAPVVSDIMRANTLAARIQELSTNRLRPIEMIELISAKRPPSLLFVQTTTAGLYTLDIRAQTSNPGEVAVFQAAVRQMPEIQKFDAPAQDQRTTNEGVSTFRLLITFKPDAFRNVQP